MPEHPFLSTMQHALASALVLVTVAGMGTHVPVRADAALLLHYQMVRSDNLAPFPKWTGMLSRHQTQKKAFYEACLKNVSVHPCYLKEWDKMLARIEHKPLPQQLMEVNSFVNAQHYVQDPDNWGKGDYWETPYEFFTQSGDCEDFAIVKFLSLRRLGVSNEQMRIAIVQDMNLGGIMHAVLEVDINGQTLILDNQVPHIRPVESVYHYRPIYSINETSWWAYRY